MSIVKKLVVLSVLAQSVLAYEWIGRTDTDFPPEDLDFDYRNNHNGHGGDGGDGDHTTTSTVATSTKPVTSSTITTQPTGTASTTITTKPTGTASSTGTVPPSVSSSVSSTAAGGSTTTSVPGKTSTVYTDATDLPATSEGATKGNYFVNGGAKVGGAGWVLAAVGVAGLFVGF
ncbi:hypothetical protein HDU97_003754 [Phlyctochytrium planicorne]|nr:hypothetical protein HDU97_003754 [Phlyctochytrium planicorne]